MELQSEEKNKKENEMFQEWEQSHRRGRFLGGLIIVGIGALFLAREMGVIMPHWIFSWKMLLIVIGLYIGVKHSFRNPGWLIPVFIGGAFLLEDFYPQFMIANFIWPVAIIFFGLIMM